MRARRVVAWVVVLAWVTACATSDDEAITATTPGSAAPTATVPSSTVPSSTVSVSSTTLPAGLDVRRGVVDGHTWVLSTQTTDVDGELCLRLVWEGETQGWSSCYVVDAGMGALPWVDPFLPRGDSNVHFMVGLAPLGSRTVQARRGATLLGEAEVFPGDTLHLGRLGFAFPLLVSETTAITSAVEVPGLGVRALLGVLPPMEVGAYDAAGGELARAGRLVGAAVDVPYLVVGDDPDIAIEVRFGTQLTPGGGVFPWDGSPTQYGYVVVAAGAAYEVAVGGRIERRDLVAMPGTSPQMFLAVVVVGTDDMMSTTFTILDDQGRTIETVPLGQYLGG